MRAFLFILASSFLPMLLGCDGHGRVLYLQQPAMTRPPWSVATAVIPVPATEDVQRLLADVAAGLHLTYDTRLEGFTTKVGDYDSFTMSSHQEQDGRWVIRLLDWPSFTRSDLSVKAEQAIREAISSGKYVGSAVPDAG